MTPPGGEPFRYVGSELDLFAAAVGWKAYVRQQVAPYLGREVLEVGAGHGGTTRALVAAAHPETTRWVGLEPDAALAGRLARTIEAGGLPAFCAARLGTLAALAESERFETILYMDVLEHIEDDRAELARAAARLRPGGHLVVLSPAHPWLFTPFDRAIGHYRRYTLATLCAAVPPDSGLEAVRLRYLDAVGMLASLGNRLVLRSARPTPRQIAFWDRLMVPLSRRVDPLLAYSVGKSVLGVWRLNPGR
jgi:SAM-dependent methyltransferase